MISEIPDNSAQALQAVKLYAEYKQQQKPKVRRPVCWQVFHRAAKLFLTLQARALASHLYGPGLHELGLHEPECSRQACTIAPSYVSLVCDM